MSKAFILVPFLIGYFAMRIIVLILCIFGVSVVDFHDNGDYICSSVISVTVGMIFVFVYLLLKYFGIV